MENNKVQKRVDLTYRESKLVELNRAVNGETFVSFVRRCIKDQLEEELGDRVDKDIANEQRD